MSKLPNKDRFKEIRDRFNREIRKPPSDSLVDIVEESTENYEKSRKKDKDCPEQVAKGLDLDSTTGA